MQEFYGTDLVIIVLGPVGVGKSSFINLLLGPGGPVAAVNDGFEACTTKLCHYVMPEDRSNHPAMKNRRLILLDTPGFQNTFEDDSQMLYLVADWLSKSYQRRMKIAGIVYIFPIFPDKMTHHERKNLELLRRLFGEDSLFRIFLLTSRWNICPREIGERREQELKDKYWSEMIRSGATMYRFKETQDSTNLVLASVLNKFASTVDEELYSAALPIQAERETQGSFTFIARILARQKRHQSGSKRNIVILISETGVGKSTFINDLAGDEQAPVNHGMQGSSSIDYYEIPSEDGETILTFVECPGYNHALSTNSEISLLIYKFLKAPYPFSSDSKIIGIVCLVDLRNKFDSHSEMPISILTNARLTCAKLLAVTFSRPLHPSMNIEDHTAVKLARSGGVQMAQYEYDSSNYAWPLIRSMQKSSSGHVPLQTFLRVLLHK